MSSCCTFAKMLLGALLMGNLCSCSISHEKEDKYSIQAKLAREFREYLTESINTSKSSLVASQFVMKTLEKAPAITHVQENSEGTRRNVLCVDLGGTSLKMGIYQIGSDGQTPVKQTEDFIVPIPKTAKEIGDRTIYEFMSEQVNQFVRSRRTDTGDAALLMEGALTFSYPLESHDGKMKVVKFTKKFGWKRVETEHEIPLDELNKMTSDTVAFRVILNDTTALGAWAGITHENAIGGFVLGTGMNCSYLESSPEAIRIFNTECGSFNFTGIDALTDSIDAEMANNSPEQERNVYLLEKMVGGLYFEEYINLCIEKSIEETTARKIKCVIGEPNEQSAHTKKSFVVKNHRLSPEEIEEDLIEFFRSEHPDHIDILDSVIRMSHSIVEKTTDRKHKVCAALLAGMISKSRAQTGRNSFVFGLTGSGCKGAEFQRAVKGYIASILKEIDEDASGEASVEFEFSEEASLLGGACAYARNCPRSQP
ncbi:hexokinase [Nematocida major]|uniref:hexokinase n=1 Tax=Nematocida major TaxID=1912982 RepID=UPI002008217B|nr:hexokinase [Nematocida major]KAH9386861.1 hexokinase [Nematocida major]